MDPEAKRLWVEALRSGEYKQGVGALNRGDSYCCLGVLCEVAIKAGLPVQVTRGGGCESKACQSCPEKKWYDKKAGRLPDSVVKWAGLVDADPYVAGRDLSAWNDEERAPFGKIADLIDEHL